MPDVDGVGADENGEIRPVVDDEGDAEAPCDLPRLLEDAQELPVGKLLLPQLDEIDAPANSGGQEVAQIGASGSDEIEPSCQRPRN